MGGRPYYLFDMPRKGFGLILLAASCFAGEPTAAVDVDTNGGRLLQRAGVIYPAEALTKRIEGVVEVRVKVDNRGVVEDASIISGPDELTEAVVRSARAWQFAADAASTTQQVTVRFHIFDTNSGVPPLRVDAAAQREKLVNQRPYPVYPPLAKAAWVQGVVSFQAVIGVDGHVHNLMLLSGPPLLVRAALDSVQQWVYQPTLVDGIPVEVITTIDVRFTLADL
jgi:TonB family protein